MYFDVISPFQLNIAAFNNQEAYGELTFITPGGNQRLGLHRIFLCPASRTVEEAVNGRINTHCKFRAESKALEWLHNNADEIYCRALIKWLRFCYGENQSFDAEECPAALTLLVQLKLRVGDNVKEDLEAFMIDAAKRNVEVGARMLCDCALKYEECESVGERLAKVVLTAENMRNNGQLVVDECLMNLPPKYLDFVKYGEEGSEISEFNLRRRYIRNRQNHLDDHQKRDIIERCDLSKLTSGELRALCLLDVFDDKEMVRLCLSALESKENHLKSSDGMAIEKSGSLTAPSGNNNDEINGYPFWWMLFVFFLAGLILDFGGDWISSMPGKLSYSWQTPYLLICFGMNGILFTIFLKKLHLVLPTFGYIIGFFLGEVFFR